MKRFLWTLILCMLGGGNVLSKVYTGYVRDSSSGRPLDGAVVSLLKNDTLLLASGITDADGFFKFNLSKEPANRIEISFLGYATMRKTISGDSAEIHPGTFLLPARAYALEDIQVKGSTREHSVDRTSYLITAAMRAKSSTLEELAGELPGVRFSPVNGEISVNGRSEILFFVDGMSRNAAYIRQIAPERVERIEIIKDPTGRYQAEGYDAILNIVLKKEYRGYDVNLKNFAIVNPAGTNGNHPFANEQPGITASYADKKLELYGQYGYADIHWNTPVSSQKTYEGILEMNSLPVNEYSPNNHFDYRGSKALLGISYAPVPKHTLLAEFGYNNEKNGAEEDFIMEVRSLPTFGTRYLRNLTENTESTHNYTGSVSYKGSPGKKITLSGDLVYNYYNNRTHNLFFQEEETPFSAYSYRNRKQYTRFAAEGGYQFSDNQLLTLGYVNIWKKYTVRDVSDGEISPYNENRNRAYASFEWNFSPRAGLKIGTGVEHLRMNNPEKTKTYVGVQPFLQWNYEATDWLDISGRYIADSEYPSLYQLSPAITAVDSLMFAAGNPNLPPVYRHLAALEFTLWDDFYLIPSYQRIKNMPAVFYTKTNDAYYRSFLNTKFSQWNLILGGEIPLGEMFRLEGEVNFYSNRLTTGTIDQRYKGWTLSATAGFFHPGTKLGVDLEYDRNMSVDPLPQGFQTNGQDVWMLSFMKKLWKDRAFVSMSYILPVSWGVRETTRTEIATPFYRESNAMNLRTYRNMLFIRLNVRFSGGKQTKSPNRTSVTEDENRKGRGLLGTD